MMTKKWMKSAKVTAVLAATALLLPVVTGCGNEIKMSDYSKYVTLGQYEGLEYEELSTEVTQEELDAQVNSYLQSWGTYDQVYEGEVKEGDTINLDYVGYVDGEPFEGGDTKEQGTQVTIGTHQFIDDFEDQLIGHAVGEENIEVNVTFPADYKERSGDVSELAGKEATFICRINYIYEITIPTELTDDMVSTNTQYDTVNSFMDALKMQYEEYKKEKAKQQKTVQLLQGAIDNATITGYPQDEYKKLKEGIIEDTMATAEEQEMDYDTYLSQKYDTNGDPYTPTTYEAEVETYVKELLNERMVVCSIAKEQGFTVTKDEVEAYAKKESENSATATIDAIYEMYGKDELAYYVISDKVVEFLSEKGVAKK